MKGGTRAAWDPDRPRSVRLHSLWRRREGTDVEKLERWKVTATFNFENGNGEMFAVRVRCFGSSNVARVRHMSETRFRFLFVEEE